MTPVPELSTYVLDSHVLDWVPAGDGLTFTPLAFFPGDGGWIQLLRLEPGTMIPLHRHTGEVHALNLSGHRLVTGSDTLIGPYAYVHERAGDVDSRMAVGDEPCVVHVEVHGTVEYLAADGAVELMVDADLQRQVYLAHCDAQGRQPNAHLLGSMLVDR